MYLQRRHRINRRSAAIRSLVAETTLSADDFIVPLFIEEGTDQVHEIPSMPGYFRRSLDKTLEEVRDMWSLGLKSVLLFIKCPDSLKDNTGLESWNPEGLMPRAIRAIKEAVPEMVVMTDVALDPYSSFGHDGIVDPESGAILNDETVEALTRMSLCHAAAGADYIAPSDMMDGRIGAFREALEKNGYIHTGILAYSAKYASCFYGPFREALDSAPGFGDKKTYQMHYANRREALDETLQDIAQGADIVMVKPALAYLDIIREVKNEVRVPVAAYQVSGEYAMIKAASERGWLEEDKAVLESLMAIKRAGADLIVTYFARQALALIGR
jgi:porphobilinogen synthase